VGATGAERVHGCPPSDFYFIENIQNNECFVQFLSPLFSFLFSEKGIRQKTSLSNQFLLCPFAKNIMVHAIFFFLSEIV
jgi:hypothetical protein